MTCGMPDWTIIPIVFSFLAGFGLYRYHVENQYLKETCRALERHIQRLNDK